MAYDIVGIVDPKEVSNLQSLNTEIQNSTKSLIAFLELQGKLKSEINKVSESQTTATEKATNYQKIIDQTITSQNKLDAQSKILADTEKKLNAVNTETNIELIKKKKLLAEENELTKQNTILTDKNSGSLEKAIASNKLLEMEKKKLNLTTKEGLNRLKEINAQQDKNNELLASGRNEEQKRIGGIGQYRQQLTGLFSSLKNGEIGLGGFTKGIWAMSKAFLASPIGWITLAIAALVAIFKNFEPLIDRINQGFAALSATWGVLKNALGQFLSGNKSLKESFEGLGGEMKQAAIDAIELKKAEQELEDQAGALEVSNKRLQTQYNQLILQSKNRTLTEQQRIELIDQADKIETQIHENRKKQNDEEIRISQENIRIKNNLTADQYAKLKEVGLLYVEELKDQGVQISQADSDRLKAALLKEQDIEQESISLSEKAMNRRDVLADKQAEKDAKRAEEKKKQDEKLAEEKRKADQKIIDDLKVLTDEQKRIDDAAAQYVIDNAEKEYRQQVNLIRATSKTKEEADKKIQELDEKNLRTTIGNLNEQLMSVRDGSAEWYKIKSDLAKAEQNLNDSTTEAVIANNEAIQESDKKTAEKKKELFKAAYEGTMQVAGALNDFIGGIYDGELTKLERKNEQGLLSDKEYARQKAQIEIKQATLNKVSGIFNAGISTAQAIIGMLKDPGGIAGTILAVAAGITGGLQIGKIIAEPLPVMPAFYKGGIAEKGIGTIAEYEPELMRQKSGKWSLWKKPGIFAGEEFKGARIYPGEMSKMMMSMSDHSGFGGQSFSDNNIVSEIKELRKDIKNKPTWILDKETHKPIGYTENGSTQIYLDRIRGI